MALSDYIQSFLGNLYDYLAYDASDIDFIEDETLEALGITAESQSTSKAIHAVARKLALEKVLVDLSTDFSFSADGSSYKLDEVTKNVQERLLIAQGEAEQYLDDGANVIVQGNVEYSQNPYNVKTYVNW